jgi:hypothetical protein
VPELGFDGINSAFDGVEQKGRGPRSDFKELGSQQMLTTESEEARTRGYMATRLRLVDSLKGLLRWASVDRAVVYGILRRAWAVVAGPVTMLLIAARFTRELQGYYYTFYSLLALQVFIELGLGQVVLQFASHEWSRLSLDKQRRIVGDSEALSRLLSLGRFAFRWYAVGGGLAALGLGLGGFVFFDHSPHGGIEWVAPWFALCVLTGFELCLLSLWSLLEGCNQVAEVYAIQFGQTVLRSLTIWLAIWLGAGLWTAPVSSFVGIVWAGYFLYQRYGRFFRAFVAPVSGPTVSWRAEMLPLQWRFAVTWLSGYFCFSLFTPAIFKFQGPVAAGQMGMTWSMVGIISSISATWINAKAPRFGMLVAKKEYAALDRLALRSGVAAFGVACCGAITVESLVYVLNVQHVSLASRLLPPLPTGLFLLAIVLSQLGTLIGAYLRAHKQEPLMVLSVISGLLIGLSTVLLGWRYGATGMAAGYLGVVALVMLPFGTIIWYRCRAAWHAPAERQDAIANVV